MVQFYITNIMEITNSDIENFSKKLLNIKTPSVLMEIVFFYAIDYARQLNDEVSQNDNKYKL